MSKGKKSRLFKLQFLRNVFFQSERKQSVSSVSFWVKVPQAACEERIHIYFAELADGQHAQDQDPDENVFPVVLSEDEVEEGVRNGTIIDSKTLSAWACYRLMK